MEYLYEMKYYANSFQILLKYLVQSQKSNEKQSTHNKYLNKIFEQNENNMQILLKYVSNICSPSKKLNEK